MSRRIMASGTRAPDRIVLSALIPVKHISYRAFIKGGGVSTERCLILDIVSEQVPGTDCRKLGESLKKSFCLCALPNAWCADQNDARCF
jgi:hypothetical protein